MKIFRLSYLFISKFKINQLKSSHHFLLQQSQNALLKTNCCLVCPAYCYSSVKSTCEINFPFSKNGKLFQEKENEYAHKVMENIPEYASSLLKHPLLTDRCLTDSVLPPNGFSNAIDEFFRITQHNMSENLVLENEKFTNLVQKVLSELSETSDENINKLLYYLCLWPPASSTTAMNFKVLWNALDRECVKRLNKWDVSQKLIIADYWFHLKLSRISQYNSTMICNLVKDIEPLLSHEVVQLLFYINLQRRIPELFLPNLEKKLESIIKLLTTEEIGIVCLGFFKTQSRISNLNLLQSIIKQFMNNVAHVNTVTVAAILKFLRKSINLSLIDSYILTLHKCIPFIDNFDIPTSVHLALLACECNVYHPLLLNCILERLIRDFSSVRIKDCGKLLMGFSLHNHFDQKFYDCFFAELKKGERQSEIAAYPKPLVHSALAYAYIGHYNYDFLSKLFKSEFIERVFSVHPELRPTYAELNYCIEIECADYTGPRLNSSDRNILQNRRGNLPSKSQSKNMQTRLLSDVYESLSEMLSDKNVLIRHILPHVYSPDIIVRISGNTDKPLSDFCKEFSNNDFLKPPFGEVWAAFVICGSFSFAYKSTHMSGITMMKLRQLEKLGYHVMSIPYFSISRKSSQRQIFLKEKLNLLEEKCQAAH